VQEEGGEVAGLFVEELGRIGGKVLEEWIQCFPWPKLLQNEPVTALQPFTHGDQVTPIE
jgi:hypothetical protein